jgi:predicted site-specific integrase-resolvase
MLDAQRQGGHAASRTARRTRECRVARVGYARVSTTEQDLALQRDALIAAGCERVFDDRSSGARADRPGLAQVLAYLRSGYVLVVWKLDRLGRSMAHLVETIRELERRGVCAATNRMDGALPRLKCSRRLTRCLT